MNDDPDKDEQPTPPEASTSTQAKDDVPAVKMQSDQEWMDVIQGTVSDVEDTK